MITDYQRDGEPHMLDLPAEAIAIITRHINVQDLLNLCCTSKSLCALLDKDEVWGFHVDQWLKSQDFRSGVTASLPAVVKSSLGLCTYRATCQALYTLKAWPVGVWSCFEGSWYPRGVLARVVQRGNTFEYGFLFFSRAAVVEPWPAHNAAEFERNICTLRITSHSGVWVTEMAALENDWHRFGANSEIKFDPIQPHMYIRWNGSQQYPTPSAQEEELEAHAQPTGSQEELGWFTFQRVPEIARWDVPDIYINERKLFLPLGMYLGLYGPHGIEVLSVVAMGAQAPAPPGCPLHGLPMLKGQKLIGDRNVPASKVSFVAALDEYRQGPYQPERDDPFPHIDGTPRHILSTRVLGPIELVAMETRPVAFVLPHAAGQINRVPGTWAPEWVTATVVIYERENVESAPLFSVIFEDEGEDFRHAIDFFSFPSAVPLDREESSGHDVE